MNKIRAIAVRPEEPPQVLEIEDELKAYQRFVGGYIQVLYPFEDAVGIICNDEGKFNGSQLNRALYASNGKIYDIIAGSFLIVGLEGEGFASLTDEQVAKFSECFARPEIFINVGGVIHVCRV